MYQLSARNLLSVFMRFHEFESTEMRLKAYREQIGSVSQLFNNHIDHRAVRSISGAQLSKNAVRVTGEL